ncbi:MAG: TraB/GumN family protein [Nanoarchaeota archaeon]|nr:TraB/GumN family protein [Nanoarchaeota archaeon]
MKYKNLEILGTSHIAKQSLEQVKDRIDRLKPDIIALELDRKRLYALIAGKRRRPRLKDIRRIGLKGYALNQIGAYVEHKLGKMVGVKPGSEMVLAFNLAKKKKLKVALIDQDVEVTLKKLSKALTFKEKLNFFVDLFKGIVLRKKEIDFDLTKVPTERIIRKMMVKVKKRYPNFHKVLVEDRNKYMAQKMANLMAFYPEKKVLAIIGAGHVKEIIALTKKAYEKHL